MTNEPLEKPNPVDVDSTQLPPDMLEEMRAYVRDNPKPAATDDPDARMKYAAAASALEDERKRREAEEAARVATPQIPDVLYGLWHPKMGFNGPAHSLDIVAYRSNADAETDAVACSRMWKPVLIGVNPSQRDEAKAMRSFIEAIASGRMRPSMSDARYFLAGVDAERKAKGGGR